jgi:group II intron reverse transcriptase/maturase
MMHGREKSDEVVVPAKPSNKPERSGAEMGEGRTSAKGNSQERNAPRTQSRAGAQSALARVREVAKGDRNQRFTALLHHVYDIDRLRQAYFALQRDAAAGIDGETWRHYGLRLEENLQELSERLKRGAYRAKPVRRAYIPKADGRQRPLGVPTLEDKLVQRATVEVLNAVYEADFLGFSYGFRPGRGAHDALDALAVGIWSRKVRWVLDADIRSFFDAMQHEWIVKFLEHRIADERVVRLIQKWLRAGVLEEGKRTRSVVGAVQGGSVSPLLANVYLHYVFDLWTQRWRRQPGRGEMIVVRYADDFLVGFEHERDAEAFLAELRERFAQFGLELHPDKTRLLEFGRYAAEQRARRGEGKPETFDFLGFTHICAKTRSGRFTVRRQTMKKRLRAKLHEVKTELRRRLTQSIPEQGAYLRAVVLGHARYYGVPGNGAALQAFRHQLRRLWGRSLRRRGQRRVPSWQRLRPHIDRWLPRPCICHPWPSQRLAVRTQGKSRMR